MSGDEIQWAKMKLSFSHRRQMHLRCADTDAVFLGQYRVSRIHQVIEHNRIEVLFNKHYVYGLCGDRDKNDLERIASTCDALIVGIAEDDHGEKYLICQNNGKRINGVESLDLDFDGYVRVVFFEQYIDMECDNFESKKAVSQES